MKRDSCFGRSGKQADDEREFPMKHILLIATGGTIASKYTKDGLSPAITAKEILT